MEKRPNIFKRLWNVLAGPIRNVFRGRQNSAQSFGSMAGRAMSAQERNFDLEVGEMPVRGKVKAQELIEIREHCPEAATAISIISDDCFSSADGDDYGVVVSDIDVNGDAIGPDVHEIASGVLRRILPLSTLKIIVDRMIGYGDAFAELQIQTRSPNKGIQALQMLPTWEMFRIEERGMLLRFEQRRHIYDQSAIEFAPAEMVHWRYQRDTLYGRSQWYQSITDWINLKKSIDNYVRAGNDIGYNPTVHVLEPGCDSRQLAAYISAHQDKLKDGPQTHMYMLNGGDVRKLANNDPNLSALHEQVETFTRRFVGRSRVPSWMLGIYNEGSKDLSNQPSLAYARFINGIRGNLSEGIKQVLHTELILKGIPSDQWKGLIQLSYPKIHVDIHQGRELDLAESGQHPDTESRNRLKIVGGHRDAV